MSATHDLADHIEAVWSIDVQAPALEFDGRWYAWGELRDAARAIDGRLTAAGVGPAAPVGVLLRNRPGLLAALLALLVSGRCIVSLNPLQPAQELQRDLQSLTLRAVIGDEADLPVGVRDAAAQAGIVGLALPRGGLGPIDGFGAASGALALEPNDGHGDAALEILTSGTTGKPKRIRISYATLADSIADGSASAGGPPRALTLKSTPTVLFAPLMHVSGMFGALLSVFEGRPIALLEKFTVDGWVAAVQRHGARFSSLPPTPMRMVLDADVPKEALKSLIAVRAGTAPLPPQTQRAFEARYGIPVLVQYGATEWMGGLAGWTLEDHRRFIATKLGSVGRPRGDLQLRVVDAASGADMPVGQPGILEVLPRQRLGAGAAWTRTSDMASIDEDGFLYIHGRADDTIIRGGFKVQLNDVAAVLERHPAVKEAAVIGWPDDRLGHVPVAAVELRDGAAALSEAELRAYAQQQLTPYQVPLHFRIVEALPRTVSLKVSRPEVKALFA